MLSNPDRLGCRNIPSIPKLLKDSIAFNNNSISYGKRNFPAINVRLNALIQEMHLRKYGDNAVELDQASIDQAKVPLQKLAADVCQLIRGNSSTELLRWSQLSSGDQLFYSLVFEDIAAAHIDLGNVYQCHDRWGANGFLGLAFKAAKQKHDRIERKNRNETNVMYTIAICKLVSVVKLIFFLKKNRQMLLLVEMMQLMIIALFLLQRVIDLKMTMSQSLKVLLKSK